MSKRLAKKVLLIGWDAADWKAAQPLMDAGKMPTLKALVEKGVMGNLATLDPPLSPIMWTSIGTGKTADKHGVLGFTQPRADGQGIQPVLGSSRKVKAVWNILMQTGLKTHVVGWWPSHPAEPLNGVCVSDFYHKANAPREQWKMAPGTVHPEHLADTFAELRVHPEELTAQHILPFVPEAEKVDQSQDQRLWSVAKITAECSSMHAAATWILQNQEWDFMAVYLDSIDHYGHGFMKFHPPYREGIPKDLYAHYNGVVEAGYRYHDMMLQRLLQLAGEDTTVILCSDHGFHSDHLRPLSLPKEPAGPAAEHSPYGLVAMQGPGIKQDELIFGATLLDITPTILSLFGLPIAKDMDGKPLLQAFDTEVELETIESWENVEGDCGMLEAKQRKSPWAEQEALEQLVALGYIEPAGEDAQQTVEKTVRESNFYLARVYQHKNAHQQALPILEDLYHRAPDQIRYGQRLASCYQALERIADARRVTEDIILRWKQKRIQEAEASIAKAKAEGKDTRKMSLPTDPHSPQLELLQGNLYLAENDNQAALECFARAQQASPRLPHLHLGIARAYFNIQRWQDAEEAYFQALDIDPDSAAANHGLAEIYLKLNHHQEAAEAAATSLGLIYHNPAGHYLLGKALYRLGRFKEAEQAWLRAVNQAPGMKKVHERLLKLYQHQLPQPLKVIEHRKLIARIQRPDGSRQSVASLSTTPSPQAAPAALHDTPCQSPPEDVITIVSGLPRSGTSMMMQMLQAGGLDILTDDQRQADVSNPQGYLEYEKVKHLIKDNSWLGEAQGKTVKIIAYLLPYLPVQYTYRIIFMQRDLDEVLQSQHNMLQHQSNNTRQLGHLRNTYSAQLARIHSWLQQQSRMQVLMLEHQQVIKRPEQTASQLQHWLQQEWDAQCAAAVVQPQLYRARTTHNSLLAYS